MRPLTDDETKVLFEKLANYIGKNIEHLINRPDEKCCFRLHKDRVYYVRCVSCPLDTHTRTARGSHRCHRPLALGVVPCSTCFVGDWLASNLLSPHPPQLSVRSSMLMVYVCSIYRERCASPDVDLHFGNLFDRVPVSSFTHAVYRVFGRHVLIILAQRSDYRFQTFPVREIDYSMHTKATCLSRLSSICSLRGCMPIKYLAVAPHALLRFTLNPDCGSSKTLLFSLRYIVDPRPQDE